MGLFCFNSEIWVHRARLWSAPQPCVLQFAASRLLDGLPAELGLSRVPEAYPGGPVARDSVPDTWHCDPFRELDGSGEEHGVLPTGFTKVKLPPQPARPELD